MNGFVLFVEEKITRKLHRAHNVAQVDQKSMDRMKTKLLNYLAVARSNKFELSRTNKKSKIKDCRRLTRRKIPTITFKFKVMRKQKPMKAKLKEKRTKKPPIANSRRNSRPVNV